MELDGRKQTVLRAIVEHYVRSGEPVGSKSVSSDPDLEVSAATIRNEMGALEREGFIVQPHTSAGRIPTDKGYRYYVDVLAPHPKLDPERREEIQRSLAGTLSALDDLLERASSLLAELTDYTAVASVPPVTDAVVRWLELIWLGGGRILVILVGQGVHHEDLVLELPFDVGREQVSRAGERMNRVAAGRRISELPELIREAASDDPQGLLSAVAEAIEIVAGKQGRTFTGGASHLISWEPPRAAARVLEAIEAGELTPALVHAAPSGVTVRIGRELAMEDIQDLSLIAAGYVLGRWGSGTLGVIGPTRMDYPTVISTVSTVARTLSDALRRLEGG